MVSKKKDFRMEVESSSRFLFLLCEKSVRRQINIISYLALIFVEKRLTVHSLGWKGIYDVLWDIGTPAFGR